MPESPSLRISRPERDQRCRRLAGFLRKNDLAGAVLFDNYNILYFSGFAFIPTERPIAWVQSAQGERAMLVPRLETEHALAEAQLERVAHYLEYPGDPHPMKQLKQLLDDMGILSGSGVAADSDGYPWIFGYEGPALSSIIGLPVENLQRPINRWQAIKSKAEINLIRHSSLWAQRAHSLLQQYTRVGATETAVSLRAGNEATLEMMAEVGPLYRAQSTYGEGPSAGYRGQIGRNAAIPHALANNITFQPGDVLVTGAGCPFWGYNAELERTMFVGQPSSAQEKMFGHAKTAQEVAFEAMKPGVRCSAVDVAVRNYYRRHDLMDHWKHHTGHAIGLRYHEGPFLDTGDNTILEPGMVFTVEPGFYAPDMGGFRHSDTVAIVEDGIEMLTQYPRDWPSLVIPVS